ncbi:MAG: Hpt domain-containing protein [Bacillota bacterium]
MKNKKIEIDKDLKPIIPQFLENRKNDIKEIKSYLKEENYKEIEIIGHSMKGSGGGYGFEEITKIGELIEKAAKAEDKEKIIKQIEKLSTYLKEIEIVYI